MKKPQERLRDPVTFSMASYDHISDEVWVADRNGICSTDIVRDSASSKRQAMPCALRLHLLDSARFNDAVLMQLQAAHSCPSIEWSSFAELQIPLPPLEVQKEIVAEIEGYQKVIDGARAVLDNYRPHIPIHPDWPMVELGEVARSRSSTDIRDRRLRSSGFKRRLSHYHPSDDRRLEQLRRRHVHQTEEHRELTDSDISRRRRRDLTTRWNDLGTLRFSKDRGFDCMDQFGSACRPESEQRADRAAT